MIADLRAPVSRTYHCRKITQGNRDNQALISLARRQCDVLFAELRDGTSTRHPLAVGQKNIGERSPGCTAHTIPEHISIH